MRGIDEETLLAVRASLAAEGLNTDAIDALISLKIRELNPWLPIDENTPKDRWLLVFDGVDKWIARLSSEHDKWYVDIGMVVKPIQYQELPDDPEPGDKNND